MNVLAHFQEKKEKGFPTDAHKGRTDAHKGYCQLGSIAEPCARIAS